MKGPSQREFRLCSAADLSRRRTDLIRGGRNGDADLIVAKQKELAVAAADTRSNSSFLEWFRSIGSESEALTFSFRPKNRPLTGQEVANPPIETEFDHHAILKDLPPRLAALPSFWTSYQLEMARLELIDPADLATDLGNSRETGRARLQKAVRRSERRALLNESNEGTRTILRQLGGMVRIRFQRA